MKHYHISWKLNLMALAYYRVTNRNLKEKKTFHLNLIKQSVRVDLKNAFFMVVFCRMWGKQYWRVTHGCWKVWHSTLLLGLKM